MNQTMEELKQRMVMLLESGGVSLTQGPKPAPKMAPDTDREDDTFEPFMLREWRRISIPNWRQILEESVTARDTEREAYARWMLSEVLLEPRLRGARPMRKCVNPSTCRGSATD